MFVEATKDDKLLKMFKDTEENYKVSEEFRIKFVPKSGVKLKDLITKKDPFQDTCGASDCLPCVSMTRPLGKSSKCRLNRIVYEARCRTCANEGKERIYHEETARNLYERSKEHVNSFKNKSPNSFMNKHVLSEHKGKSENIVFDWKVLNKFQKPLSRQLKETLYIENKETSVNMNLKSEYLKNNTRKIMLNKVEYTCNKCGRIFGNKQSLQAHMNDIHEKFPCNSDNCVYEAFGTKDLANHEAAKH